MSPWANWSWPRSGDSGSPMTVEDLPTHEAGEEVVELSSRRLGDRVDGGAGEAGAEHREVAHQRALLRGEAVEAGHQQGGEGGGHLEVVERAHEAWPDAVGLHQAAVDERSDDLDGVERDPLGLVDDVLGHVGGEVDEVVEEPEHRRAVERVEADAGAVAALPPPWSALGQLGSGQGQDEDGVGRRPVEDRVEEVEQRRRRPTGGRRSP